MQSFTNWYQANYKFLLQEIDRVRKNIENFIEGKENQPNVTEFVLETSALAQLCIKFNLSPFERDILLLCAGMEIEPNFSSLCAQAQKNSTNKYYPTLGLALDAFPGANWRVFSTRSPLHYWQLLQIEPGLILRKSPLQIDKRILCYLLGEDASDEELAGIIKPIPPQTNLHPLPISQAILVEQLINIWSGTNSFPVIQLSRSDRSTKYNIVSTACQYLGVNLQTLSAAVLTTNPQELDQLCLRWSREAILSNSVLFLDCDSSNIVEPGREFAICQFIETINTPLILSSNERKFSCQRPLVNFDIPQLSHLEQKALWEYHLGESVAELNGQIDSLAAQFNLNSATIAAACYQFKIQNSKFNSCPPSALTHPYPLLGGEPGEPGIPSPSNLGYGVHTSLDQLQNTESSPPSPPTLGGTRFQSPPGLGDLGGKTLPDETRIQSPPELTSDPGRVSRPKESARKGDLGGNHQSTQLWDFCRLQARNQLDELAQHINATATWDELVLPTQQRQLLSDIATHLRRRFKVYQEWGFASKGDRGLGISALFYGASGTGKTMAAEVLANEFRLDLYRIDLSRVVSKYIGETEKNLRKIFDAAETGSAILLFDEADALFGKRTEVKDSHDRHANIEVSYLLQRMEAYQGLAILTSNFQSALDSAFERRIRFTVEFPVPDAGRRSQIWQRIFPTQTPTQGLDYQKLGQLKVAGGNIRNIALNAAFLAANGDEPVMMEHILEATKREYLKLKKMLTNEETKGWF